MLGSMQGANVGAHREREKGNSGRAERWLGELVRGRSEIGWHGEEDGRRVLVYECCWNPVSRMFLTRHAGYET